MSLTVVVRQSEDVSILDVIGRFTLGEGFDTFRNAIHSLLANGRKQILLNLVNVNDMDSSGVGELVSAYKTISNKGGQLKLLNLSYRVEHWLQTTRLFTVFKTFKNEDEAIRSFS